jgi:peptidoglycan/LPS O-acetylase OafA/YrhL
MVSLSGELSYVRPLRPVQPVAQRSRMRHVPALDGLRGVAVLGVVAHHLGYLRGGFLGVDLFFVLSGYLITSLVLHEWAHTGRVDLGRFWSRRARRLLPAVFVVLGAVIAYAAYAAQDIEKDRIREDGLFTLFYIQNWHEIFTGISYWDQFSAPSPLRHMWSLAIEEQFYLLWPLVLVLVLGRPRPHDRRRPRLWRLLALTVGLGTASAAAMVLQHHSVSDVSRVYYGTDTRVAAILIGAALATLFRLGKSPNGSAARTTFEIAAVGAVAALGVAWVRVGGQEDWLYEGGFLLCGLAVGVVITAVANPRPGPVGRLFSLPPLRWLGAISYGLYLWHWPVIVYVAEPRFDYQGPTLALIRLALSLGLSVVSYLVVEQPIRRGRVPTGFVRVTGPTAFATCAALLVFVTIGPSEIAPGVVAGAGNRPGSTAEPVHAEPEPVPLGGSLVLVVGDSGAYFLGDGMVRVAPEFSASVVNRGIVGCGIGDGDSRIRFPNSGEIMEDNPRCAPNLDRYRYWLAGYQPNVVFLFQAAAGGVEREIDGQWYDECSDTYHDWYLAKYLESLRMLRSSGVPVVVGKTPYMEGNYASVNRGTDCRNAVVEEAVEQVPGTRILDLLSWLCRKDGQCDAEREGIKLRYEAVHFRDAGADYAARWILPQVLEGRPEN